MSKRALEPKAFLDSAFIEVLQQLLEQDLDITARAVARLHPTISSASTITRSEQRATVLEEYRIKQLEFRRWQKNISKRSSANVAMSIADKDMRIAELEKQIEVLVASHLAMIKVVGEMGGFSKWQRFFEMASEALAQLSLLNAIPESNKR